MSSWIAVYDITSDHGCQQMEQRVCDHWREIKSGDNKVTKRMEICDSSNDFAAAGANVAKTLSALSSNFSNPPYDWISNVFKSDLIQISTINIEF